jgi:hypothetical protein
MYTRTGPAVQKLQIKHKWKVTRLDNVDAFGAVTNKQNEWKYICG